jgi:hypothetical protein
MSTATDLHTPPTYSRSFRRVLLGGLAVIYTTFAFFAREHRLPVFCPFRRLTGVRCPLCGFTTSTGHLLHGEIRSAFKAHPLGPVVIAGTALWSLHLAADVIAGKTH